MGIYQGLSEYKPDALASASIQAYTLLALRACIGKKLSAARLNAILETIAAIDGPGRYVAFYVAVAGCGIENFITHSIGASGWIFTNSNLRQIEHKSFASNLASAQLVIDAEKPAPRNR